MKRAHIWFQFFVVFCVAMLFFVACTPTPACTTNKDCLSAGQVGQCAQHTCVYTPLAQQSCTTSQQCEKNGYVSNCVQGTCAWNPGIKHAAQIKYFTDSVNSAGNVFAIATTFTQPFNIFQDRMSIKLELTQQQHTAIVVKRIELEGDDVTTKQRIVLASKITTKNFWQAGDVSREELALDFPTSEQSGMFDNLLIRVTYTGMIDGRLQTNVFSTTLRNFVMNWQAITPTTCLASCDDQTSGTTDVCSAETQYVCVHTPIVGACGNGVCDGAETMCSCATDCGPCQTVIGSYVERACTVNNTCTTRVKPSTTKKPFTVLDERSTSALKFSTRISYTQPYDTSTDTLLVDLTLFDKQPDITLVRITGVQLLEGQNLIAEQTITKTLTALGTRASIELHVKAQELPEIERWLTLAVTYEYARQKSSQPVKERFERQLGKITLLSP